MRSVLVAFAVALSSILSPLAPRAHAASVMFNGGTTPHGDFGPNQQVTISGDLIGGCVTAFGFFNANVYVVSHGTLSAGQSARFDRAPNAVITNNFTNGLFVGELIGFTGPTGTLGSGDYDVVLDACQAGGYFPNAGSFLVGADQPHGALTVTIPTNAPSLDSSILGLKATAQAQAQQWQQTHTQFYWVFKYWDAMEWLSAGFDALSPLPGGGGLDLGLEAALAVAKAVGVEFVMQHCCDLKDAFQDAMLDQLVNMARQSAAIAADPPDPSFMRLDTLDSRKTHGPDSTNSVLVAAADVGNAVSSDAALETALLHSVERYQGAAAAHDGHWALIHARAIKHHAQTLGVELATTNSAVDSLIQAIGFSTMPISDTAGNLNALAASLAASGFTPAENQAFSDLHLTADQIDQIKRQVITDAASSVTKASLMLSLADLKSSNATMIAHANTLATQMDAVITALVGDPSVANSSPIADAGGPYTGTAGTPVTLTAAASSSPTPITQFEWDLTGSGSFGDATGPSPTFVFNTGFSGLVGVRVTNAAGVQDVAYAPLQIDNGRRPPSISATTPIPQVVTILAGASQQFSVTASQPDGDALQTRWFYDGGLIGAGNSIVLSPRAADAGAHRLEALVADTSPLGKRIRVDWAVGVQLPAPNVGFTLSPAAAIAGQLEQFSDTSISLNGPITAWHWDFGDGATSSLQNPTHTFATAGTYTVTLTATSTNGGIGSSRQRVVVQNGALPTNVVFADNFPGQTLNTFWSFDRGYRPQAGLFFSRAGLVINSYVSDYSPTVQSDPMIFTRQAGDWTARLQVQAWLDHAGDEVGLLGINPDNPAQFWKFGYLATTAVVPNGPPPSITVYDGSVRAQQSFSASTAPYLEVVKSGDTYTFSTSADGATWTRLYQAAFPLGTQVKLGVFSQGTDHFFRGRAVQFALNAPLPGARFPGEVGLHAYDVAPDYFARDFATGFPNDNSTGPIGVAVNASGDVFVVDIFDNHLYRFGSSGGVASPSTRITAAPIPGGPSGLAFGKDGRLYLGRKSGDVVELDAATGRIVRTVANIPGGAYGLATDPLSGDLFATTACTAPGIVRIAGFANGPGTVSAFGYQNCTDGLTFNPDGTLFAKAWSPYGGEYLVKIDGTDKSTAGIAALITNLPTLDGLAIAVGSNPHAPPYVVGNRNDGLLTKVDLSAWDGVHQPPQTDILVGGTRGDFVAVGLNGCLYATQTSTVLEIRNADGSCPFAPTSVFSPPADTLPPATQLTPNPPANAAGWNNTDVTLSFTANDVAPSGVTPSGVKRITARDGLVDLGCTVGASCSATLTTEGTHTTAYFATDNAGNSESVKFATVKIDKHPPNTSWVLSGPTPRVDGSYASSPTVTLVATDPALDTGAPGSGVVAIYWQTVTHASPMPGNASLDGWTSYVAPFSFRGTVDVDVYAFSVDAAGNVATPMLLGRVQIAPVTTPPPTDPGGGGIGNPPPTGATPELDSLILFGAGLGGLAGYGLRRLRALRRRSL